MGYSMGTNMGMGHMGATNLAMGNSLGLRTISNNNMGNISLNRTPSSPMGNNMGNSNSIGALQRGNSNLTNQWSGLGFN
jgi:hypothetical protein